MMNVKTAFWCSKGQISVCSDSKQSKFLCGGIFNLNHFRQNVLKHIRMYWTGMYCLYKKSQLDHCLRR